MKENSRFSRPHLQLAHTNWQQYLSIGDSAIDATCGNGHDTLELCKLALSNTNGHIFAFDIQAAALETTALRLRENLSPTIFNRVTLLKKCHSDLTLPFEFEEPIKLIVYNLGYLPGADKAQTTCVQSTLRSLKSATTLLAPGGLISITCYPGHPEGALEEEALLEFAAKLPRETWNCCHHRWINRQRAPSLLLITRSLSPL
ncbi:MAG: class I SAM-dependent methyltransferase [Parachlamydiaceae bacterium]|nr:class I SAM-dependent methyltransferase [Parachlamydiaceae bacterium]